MTESLIYETQASADDIQVIIDLIEPTLIGFPREHAFIATLSMAVMLMKPDIGEQELKTGIESTSKYLCSFLAGEQIAMDVEIRSRMN